MRLVKISDSFFNECKKHSVHKELLFNEDGRPSVLLISLKYKEQYRKFVVPMRSNNQYLPLPPNSKTKLHHSHGIHYIKIFPIIDKYVQTYLISEPFDLMIKNNHNTFLYYMYEKKNYHTLLVKKQKRLSGINM